jgi:hypothetical protein
MYQVVPGPGGGPAAAITIEAATDFVWTGVPLSLTVAVKLNVPLVVGFPSMIPVLASRVSPAGRHEPEPEQVSDQV